MYYTLYSHSPCGHHLPHPTYSLPTYTMSRSAHAICYEEITAAAAVVSGQTRVRSTSETGPHRIGNDVIQDGFYGYGQWNDVMVNPASWSGTVRGIH